MQLRIPKDYFDNPCPPRVFLCNTAKKRIGELPVYETELNGKWNAYSELSFSIDRMYTDILTGETKVHPLFDKVEGLRQVYVENMGYFIIQDPDATYSDSDTKTVTCFSSEYSTGSKYLENFRVNTGDVDSKEVTYLASLYGENYTIDTPYELAISGEYDEYESYYIKKYKDNKSYTYEQIQIVDQNSYQSHFGEGVNSSIVLYKKKYPNVRFYYPSKPQLSLLHLIFEKIPEWTIGNVDTTLWRKERKFDEDRIAVYDFLMNEVSDTFNCVVEWDTINSKVNFYEEAEDGINDDNTIQTRWDTDVYISRDNLASEIKIQYSTDDIKTKLKVSGADDLSVREVNLGKNHILNLDYYHTMEWMEEDLFYEYQRYLDTTAEYKDKYTNAVQGRVAAYNKWNDLMNAVPATNDVILVGDEFKKLYCIYEPQYKEDATSEEKETAITTAETALEKKLKLYQVHKDIEANKSDNVLLKLKNADSDTATIRIYNTGTEDKPVYTIYSVVVRSSIGLTEEPSTYTTRQWVRGDLDVEKLGLEKFIVSAIGTLGAYLCLVKDETKKENLEDYGIRLLQEKQETYTKIFQTQTEHMFSQEKYQCVAMDNAPTGAIADGTRWLNTTNSTLYEYRNGSPDVKWFSVNLEADASNYENYQRYIDNYEKLKAVQTVLAKKEKEAEYILNGYVVPNRKIDFSKYELDDDGVRRYNGKELKGAMMNAAIDYFYGYTVTDFALNAFEQDIPLYFFTTSKYPNKTFAVYLNGSTPYIAYAESQGVYQAKMNYISRATELEEFFKEEDQWIRLSPLIREDEFSDDNFLLTGYESEEERIKIYNELLEAASKELKTLSQPSLEFSMDMGNILALPEFKPLVSQFQLGNFVRVHIRDNYTKRARLLEVHLSFDDLSDFSCDFGNLVTTKSEIDKHAELLKQAVTAGKQVAASASDWQNAVDKANKLEEDIAKGLQDAALEVGKASGQSLVWDQFGIWGRKLKDGSTDEYEDEQFRIINNKLVFSNDGFKTSKGVFGKYIVDGEERWGPLAEYVTADTIEGKLIKGGSIIIGGREGDTGKFIVNEDGSVQILAADNSPIYATDKDVGVLQQALKYKTDITYNNSTVFSDTNASCVLSCHVYRRKDDTDEYEDITQKLQKDNFTWMRNSDKWIQENPDSDVEFNEIKITHNDIERMAQFSCKVEFNDSILGT